MKCIVLSYDKDINMVDLLITSWEINYPNNPFIFYVPYNEIFPQWLKDKWGNKIELVKSKKEITLTIKTLLTYTERDEWVLWNRSDDYIEHIDNEFINSIVEYTKDCGEDVMSIKFSNKMKKYSYDSCKDLINIDEKVMIKDNVFLKINKEYAMWRPAIVRADYIHRLFNNLPEPDKIAKELDFTIKKYNKEFFDLPKKYTFLIPDKTDTIVVEGTSRGALTKNALNYMKKHNIVIPKNRNIHSADIERFKFDSMNLSYTELIKNKVKNINSLIKS
jgi:hypothetical protein